MPGDRGAIVAALLERADGKGVAQIVDARISPCMHTPESGAGEELQEDASGGAVGQQPTRNRDEECTIRVAHLLASDQISVDCLPDSRM